MNEPMTPEALDRYLDALVRQEEAEFDSDLAAVARRYLALGQAAAPPGARERVLRRIRRQAGPRQNGHHARQEPLQQQVVLARAVDVPGPEILQQTTSAAPVRRRPVPWRAWPAYLLLLIGLVASLAWSQARRQDVQVLTAPGADVAQPSTSALSVLDGQALFTADLPPGSLPVEGYGATFDQRTMPPHSEIVEASPSPLLFRYIVSGEVRVQSEGALEVCKADCAGSWQRAPADTSQTLTAGDAVLLRGPAALAWANTGGEPVEMIAWAMTDLGGGNSEAPPGWTLHDNAAVHMAVFQHPEQAAQLALQRRELAPGEEIGPPSGSWLSQFVTLDHNAAGEQVTPMFGKLPSGARRNAGRQDLTIYQYSLIPLGNAATSPP